MQRDRFAFQTHRATAGLAILALALVPACGGEAEAPGGTTPPAGAAAPPTRDGAAVTKARPANAPPADPIFGEPLIINGEVIPFERIKRELVMGTYGTPILESRKHEIYIQKELERRKQAGEDVADLSIPDAEVDEAISEIEASIEKEYPEGGVTVDDILPTLQPSKNREGFRDRIRLTQVFDKVFLPDNPYEYPPVTVAALDATGAEVKMVDNLKKNWDEQKKKEEETGEKTAQDAAGNAFFKKMQRSLLLQYLDKNSEILYPDDGLPEDVAMRVDGIDVKVDDVWKEIEHLVTPLDVERTKKWIVNVTLAENDLMKSGDWLSDEEYDAIYKEVHDPYKDSPFSIERIALTYRKFPSLTDYRTYFRIQSSFKKKIADEITDEALQGQLERLDLLLAGLVDCDVILISAYDFPNHKWKENGWEDARVRAEQVARELVEGKAWDEALDEYSEFWDPPIAKSQKGQPGVLRHNKGRFVGIKRNDLMRQLDESDYSIFLDSASLADHLFYYLEPGEYDNPRRGPYGYYIPLVKKRVLTARKATLSNDVHRTLAEQDLVTTRLNRYIWELKNDADIYGI